MPAVQLLAGVSLRSAPASDEAWIQLAQGASAPTPPDAPLAWALTIGTGDQDTGTGAGVGVMPTPAPGGASQGPPALSLDSLLITAAVPNLAITQGDESAPIPATAGTPEEQMAAPAVAPPAVAATQAAPSGTAPADPVVAVDPSATATGPADVADPHGSSMRATLEDLDRLTGLA